MVAPVTEPRHTAQPDLDQIEIATVLHALADPVRLEILRQVAGCVEGSDLTCGELALPVSKSTGSHHLKILHQAGLTSEREQGTRKYIRIRRDELERRFPGLLDSVLCAKDPR